MMRPFRGGHNVSYTTDSSTRATETSILLNRIQSISSQKLILPHPRLLIPCMEYREPVSVIESDLLSLSVMILLVRYVYPVLLGYAKANIIFYMKMGEDYEIAKPLNKQSIPLTLDDGTPISKSEIYAHVFSSTLKLVDIYDGCVVVRIAIRTHFQDDIKEPPRFKEELLEEVLSECLKPASGEFEIPN